MAIHDVSINALDGKPLDLSSLRGQAVLVVNVASKCGLTPQYAGLTALQSEFADQGFTVLGVPCNQFAGQEPGTADEIQSFCSTTYNVNFPITEKADTNGQRRHALYGELVDRADDAGAAGDVQWNFEKFLVSPTGQVIRRFRPPVAPDAPELVEAVRSALPLWKKVSPTDVKAGDTVRTRGQVVTVASVDSAFLGRSDMIALIVDTPKQWLKLPVPLASEIEVLAV